MALSTDAGGRGAEAAVALLKSDTSVHKFKLLTTSSFLTGLYITCSSSVFVAGKRFFRGSFRSEVALK